jgi:gamma-glutamylcyclotransferase (GGCT)/AIG2-like uncharacterized protein YtfP
MAKSLLFVYGTLKRSGTAHGLLADQEFVGEATTLPYYCLYDGGSYPCLVEDRQHGMAVHGEVWMVNSAAFAELDDYEGVQHTFHRRAISLVGYADPVEAYFYQGDVPALRSMVESGTWSMERDRQCHR